MPTELAPLTGARGEPMGEWTSEPMPGTHGRWVRLIVLRANEWSPAVRAGREEVVARAVAALDLELALPRGLPASRAREELRELVDGDALLHSDPMTAEMLEAFGWEPPGGASGSTTCPRSGCR